MPGDFQFDPDTNMFRGEFIGLNGEADFYAPDVAGLRQEGAASLNASAVAAAAAEGKSLNQWIAGTISATLA